MSARDVFTLTGYALGALVVTLGGFAVIVGLAAGVYR